MSNTKIGLKVKTEQITSQTPEIIVDTYSIRACSGKTALKNPELIDKLQMTWRDSYKQSVEEAQRTDPLYNLTWEAEQKRREIIHQELKRKGAILVYVINNTPEQEMVGFFWGLPLKQLNKINPAKGSAVMEAISTVAPNKKEKVAYLSMLGVIHDSAKKVHGGKGLGKHLTKEIVDLYWKLGFNRVVARTINDIALNKLYLPLGFSVYSDYIDEKLARPRARYIFGLEHNTQSNN
ncbi:MAG: hypothetical protein R3B92_00345 [Patescibacteria group bacterium]